MALTPAEKQRRYRERKEEKLRKASDITPARPGAFADFLRSEGLSLYENLDFVGVQVQGSLENEEHPIERADDWDSDINSLSRATAMVGAFIDAATELAEKINTFKLAEIDRQLRDTADRKERKRLEAIRARLTRKTSHFFRVIEVKGA